MLNSPEYHPQVLKSIDEIPLDKRNKICTSIDFSIHRNDGYWEKLVKGLGFDENDSKNFQLSFAKNQSPTDNLLRECSYRNYKICELYHVLKTIGLVKLAAENLQNVEPVSHFVPGIQPLGVAGISNDGKLARRPTESDSSTSSHSGSESGNIGGLDTFHFPYEEIQKGTDNFSSAMKLGAGAFGKVYKVRLKNTTFACKVLTIDNESIHFSIASKHRENSDLRNELRYLAEYRHPNIIPLYGWSLDGKDPCLIYQYMKNGSLQDCLQRLKGNKSLKWPTRAKVACDAATGLQFLHTMKEKPLIHGDIKTANILLDESFVAKLGDFGLAREGPRSHVTGSYIELGDEHTPGTIGYLAMEYMQSKKLSVQVDTYAFGVVLLELYTGRRAFDRSQRKAGTLLRDYMDDIANGLGEGGAKGADDRLFEQQDPEIERLPRKTALEFVKLALECCHEKRNKRPAMLKALSRLEEIHTDIVTALNSAGSTPNEPPLEKCPRTQSNLDRHDWLSMHTRNTNMSHILSRNPVESVDHSLAQNSSKESDPSSPPKSSDIYSPQAHVSVLRQFEHFKIDPDSQGRNTFHPPLPYGSSVQRQQNVYARFTSALLDGLPPIHPGQDPYAPYAGRNIRPPNHIPGHGILPQMGQPIHQYLPQMSDVASGHMSPVFNMWPPNAQPYGQQYAPGVVYQGHPAYYNQYFSEGQVLRLPPRNEGIDNSEPKQNQATTPVSPATPWTPEGLACSPDVFNSLDLDEQPFTATTKNSLSPRVIDPAAAAFHSSSAPIHFPGCQGVVHAGPQYNEAEASTTHRDVPTNHVPKPPKPHAMTVNGVKAEMLDKMKGGCESYSQIFKSSPK